MISMTLAKLYEKGSKDNTEKKPDLIIESQSKTTTLPWWAAVKKKGNSKIPETPLEITTRETFQTVTTATASFAPKDEKPVITVWTTTQPTIQLPYSASDVSHTELSTNTLGRPINVTGKPNNIDLRKQI